ncbi:MAG: DUF4276 family protein [Sulfuricella sp.]|nr:DUF4276 family protein [Sulfuricella sp.]
MKRLLPIVEGDGDLKAVPVLLRRLLERHGLYEVELLHPQKRGELPKVSANFDNYFRMAIKENAAILWVLDFDCDFCRCPFEEAEKLYRRAQVIRAGWPFKMAFLSLEFESLFLAEKQAATAVLKLPANTVFPGNPEVTPRDAKGWLSEAQPKGFAYKPTVHQDKIAARLDLDTLRAVSSDFRHMEKALLQLVESALP